MVQGSTNSACTTRVRDGGELAMTLRGGRCLLYSLCESVYRCHRSNTSIKRYDEQKRSSSSQREEEEEEEEEGGWNIEVRLRN